MKTTVLTEIWWAQGKRCRARVLSFHSNIRERTIQCSRESGHSGSHIHVQESVWCTTATARGTPKKAKVKR